MSTNKDDQIKFKTAINSSNLYLDLNKQGAGTLTGDDVDSKLVDAKVERVLNYADGFRRKTNVASESTLFTAGEIDASPVDLTLLRTILSPYIQNCLYQNTCIPYITIYRVDILNGKYTITETIEYKRCYIETFNHDTTTYNGHNLSSINLSFRYNQRQDTLYFFDQDSKPIGQNVSLINFSQGTLRATNGGGGDSGGGSGGFSGDPAALGGL